MKAYGWMEPPDAELGREHGGGKWVAPGFIPPSASSLLFSSRLALTAKEGGPAARTVPKTAAVLGA